MSFRIEDILKEDKKRPEEVTRRPVDLRTTILRSALAKCDFSHTIFGRAANERFLIAKDFHEKYCSMYGSRCHRNEGYRPTNVYKHPNYLPLHPRYMSIPHMMYYNKRKGGQVRFTTLQTDTLENQFTLHKYLSPEDRKILAHTLKLSDRQVKTWFQNRRAKWRRSNNAKSKGQSLSENDRGKTSVDSISKV